MWLSRLRISIRLLQALRLELHPVPGQMHERGGELVQGPVRLAAMPLEQEAHGRTEALGLDQVGEAPQLGRLAAGPHAGRGHHQDLVAHVPERGRAQRLGGAALLQEVRARQAGEPGLDIGVEGGREGLERQADMVGAAGHGDPALRPARHLLHGPVPLHDGTPVQGQGLGHQRAGLEPGQEALEGPLVHGLRGDAVIGAVGQEAGEAALDGLVAHARPQAPPRLRQVGGEPAAPGSDADPAQREGELGLDVGPALGREAEARWRCAGP